MLLLFLSFISSYAQSTKLTKQELMDWIAEKMRTNLMNDDEYLRVFVKYSNGLFTYKKIESEECGYITYTINLNKINNSYFTNIYRKNWIWQGDGIIYRDYSNKHCYDDYRSNQSNQIEIYEDDYEDDCNKCLFNFLNIEESMRRSIEILIEFNNK